MDNRNLGNAKAPENMIITAKSMYFCPVIFGYYYYFHHHHHYGSTALCWAFDAFSVS
jgi:hypothetical protein